MMATMNILARAKSFVFLGSPGVWTKDAKSQEERGGDEKGGIHFHFQHVGSCDVIVCA